MKKILILIAAIATILLLIAAVVTNIDDFFLPGSQIAQSGNLEHPDKCDNCHGGYDLAVEPAFNWRGSMMSQAARDPVFYACLAIAEQDAPGVGDMCLRCHTPDGWLNGRCEPTDGSALNNNDREGVQCDFCHKMVDPRAFTENPYPKSSSYTAETWPQDKLYLAGIIPLPGSSSNGMYIADANNAKRGPFDDATGRHQMFTSPFHTRSEHCGTCHDVSNPVFTREGTSGSTYTPNEFGKPSPTFNVREMYPIERTYSEWLASGYATGAGGVEMKTCQDCHMRDVRGKGAKMKNAPVRDNLPLHDMTGGNTFVPLLIKQQYPSEVDAAALDAGIERAKNNLQNAALLGLALNADDTKVTVTVTNITGHKLPTGYPEGRRMWINMKFYKDDGSVVESGAYDFGTGELQHDADLKIYECKPGLSTTVVNALNPNRPASQQLVAGPSFHMALNDMVYVDNRIPPAGFTNSLLSSYQSPVIAATYNDGQNWDITSYDVPTGTVKIEAYLYYQTASKEFIEFLRDKNYTNSRGQELYALWDTHGKSAPVVMNEAEIYIGDPPAPDYIMVSTVHFTRKSAKGGKAYVSALVTIDPPVSGAEVYAEFTSSSPTSGTVLGTTNAQGQVVFDSRPTKNANTNWCIDITNIEKDDYTFMDKGLWCESEAKNAFIQETDKQKLNVYPNPFTDKLYFEFTREKDSQCKIEIFDVSGKKIMTLLDQHINANQSYRIKYQANKVESNMLFYRIIFDDEAIDGKVVHRD